jgi:hypothetical protein
MPEHLILYLMVGAKKFLDTETAAEAARILEALQAHNAEA